MEGVVTLSFVFVDGDCVSVVGCIGDGFSGIVVSGPAYRLGVVALACRLLEGQELWILVTATDGSSGKELYVLVAGPEDVMPGFAIFCLRAAGVGRASCTNGSVLPSLSCLFAISR